MPGASTAPAHVSNEFENPIYAFETRRWFTAKAVLSSAPGPEYEEVQNILESLETMGNKEVVADLSNWAGDYRPSR